MSRTFLSFLYALMPLKRNEIQKKTSSWHLRKKSVSYLLFLVARCWNFWRFWAIIHTISDWKLEKSNILRSNCKTMSLNLIDITWNYEKTQGLIKGEGFRAANWFLEGISFSRFTGVVWKFFFYWKWRIIWMSQGFWA